MRSAGSDRTVIRLVPAAAVRSRADELAQIAAEAAASTVARGATAPARADVLRWAARVPGARCAAAGQGPVTGFALSMPRPSADHMATWPPDLLDVPGTLISHGLLTNGTRLLAEVHVRQQDQGHGIGTALLAATCPVGTPVVLTVAAPDRARRFYAARGFRDVAVIQLPDGNQRAVMYRPLIRDERTRRGPVGYARTQPPGPPNRAS